MKESRRKVGLLSLGMVACLAMAACGVSKDAGSSATKPDKYVIGAALPLSGSAAAVGNAFKCGIDTAVSEINAAGGINGVSIDSKILDNLLTATGAVSAMNQLTTAGINAVIMTTSQGVSATAPIATKQKVLMLNPGGSSPALIGLSPYLFTNITSLVGEVDAMLPYLKQQGYQSIAVYGQNDAIGSGADSYIKDAWPKQGGTYLGAELEDPQAIDHAAVINKLKSKNPDVLYLVASARQAGTFVNQAKSLGLKSQIVSYSGLQTGGFFPIAGANADGILDSAAAVHLDPANPLATAYQSAFAKACPGADPTNIYSILAHDAVLIYKSAIEYLDKNNMPYSGDNLRQAIAQIKTFKVAGGTTVFNPDGSSSSAIVLSRVQDQKFVTISTVTPHA